MMDRLYSPGGCPWDAEQTHVSLAPYAIEEAYEVAEAAESGDLAALREELGDLLLQIVFQARIAADGDPAAFDLVAVVTGLTAKLHSRHPHVFADSDSDAGDAEAVRALWDDLKAAERAAKGTSGVLTGIPEALPALARAQKVLGRARKAGIAVGPDPEGHPHDPAAELGADLLAVVARAAALGVDAEAALRAQVRSLVAQVVAAEADRAAAD